MSRRKLTPTERAIRAKENAIARDSEKIAAIHAAADREAAVIQKRIDRNAVLLKALKSGELKP